MPYRDCHQRASVLKQCGSFTSVVSPLFDSPIVDLRFVSNLKYTARALLIIVLCVVLSPPKVLRPRRMLPVLDSVLGHGISPADALLSGEKSHDLQALTVNSEPMRRQYLSGAVARKESTESARFCAGNSFAVAIALFYEPAFGIIQISCN